jgi:hypothetical protein
MNMFNNLLNRNRDRVEGDVTIDITELGSQLASKYDAVTPEMIILNKLHQRQTAMSMKELASETGFNIVGLRKLVYQMERRKLIMVLGGGKSESSIR